jgi:uncharacterized RDD family membrane protein YckC
MNYAGFWIRFGAHIMDFVLLNLVELGLEYAISLPLGISSFAQQIVGVILSVALSYAYYVEIPQRRGTTFGKQVLGIYVVDQNTGELFSRKQAIIRLCGYIVSYALIGCGFLMAAFNPRKQGLHDVLAGTVSIRLKKGEPVPPKRESEPKV